MRSSDESDDDWNIVTRKHRNEVFAMSARTPEKPKGRHVGFTESTLKAAKRRDANPAKILRRKRQKLERWATTEKYPRQSMDLPEQVEAAARNMAETLRNEVLQEDEEAQIKPKSCEARDSSLNPDGNNLGFHNPSKETGSPKSQTRRRFLVDSGASFHLVGRKDITAEE